MGTMNPNKQQPNVKWAYMIPLVGMLIATYDVEGQMTNSQQWWLLTYHTLCGVLMGVIVGLIFHAL